MMTRNDARLQQMLEAERAALQDSIGHYEVLARHKKPGLGNHMADDATEVFDQASGLALHLNEQALLAQVDDALERMEKGDYGLCEPLWRRDRLRPSGGYSVRDLVHSLPAAP